MADPRLAVVRTVAASPATVYAILRDYERHHPAILPKPEFEALHVEEGGVGEGTRIRVEMRVMGARTTLRMRVDEPEPGRVLRETEEGTGVVTTFTVDAHAGGTRVEIATIWPRRPGLRGWLDARIVPRVARKLYERELALLDERVRAIEGGRT